MATRQNTSKTQEQQSRQAEQSAKLSDQTKPTQTRSTETGVTPYREAPVARAGGREPLLRLRDEFDRLFDQFSRGWLGVPAGGWGIDVREDDNNVIVRAEVPGFEPSDFDIQVRGDQLIMCACHKTEEKQESGYRGWQRNEFYEALTLPSGVDADQVKAAYRQGVLTVTLPKVEDGKAKRITVQG